MVQLEEKKTKTSYQRIYEPHIEWILLPENYLLPDDPVESIVQPLLAAALTESLDLAGLVTEGMLIASNMALVTSINGETVLKAPDWFLVSSVKPIETGVIRRSYTPIKQGEIPAIVMEFLSATDTAEYSLRPFYPYGKMWFYERIIKVPIYIIFDPETGSLEIRKLNQEGKYERESLDENGRYYLEALNLYLGIWQGTRLNETTNWLRWWDDSGNLLLWGSEKIALEKQRVEAEKQRVEAEKQRAEAEKQRANNAELEIAKLKDLIQKSGLQLPDND